MSSQTRYKTCQVLSVGAEGTSLFPFEATREDPKPQPVVVVPPGTPLPKGHGARDWQQLVRPRLGVAWFDPSAVFLHLLELPTTDPAEMASMVELQLEKLSPLPVNQVAWTIVPLGRAGDAATSVLVVLAPHSDVDSRLGELERDGFVADRLEVALVRELAEVAKGDGLWLIADPDIAPNVAIAAWHSGGRWRRIDLLHLPADPAAMGGFLKKSFTQTAWAAELDGWLERLPRVRLVSPAAWALACVPDLEEWSGQSVETLPCLRREVVAARTAAGQLRTTDGSLVPAGRSARNRQKYIDRLWMQGLGTLGVLYLVGVLGYMAMLTYREGVRDDEKVNLKGLALQYTNAIALKEQVDVLEEQVNLRFAALDSWKAIADRLPDTMTLSTFNFIRGRTLRVDGTASDSARGDVLKFNSDLAKLTVRNAPLFSNVRAPRIDTRPGGNVGWSFEADLNVGEAK